MSLSEMVGISNLLVLEYINFFIGFGILYTLRLYMAELKYLSKKKRNWNKIEVTYYFKWWYLREFCYTEHGLNIIWKQI